MKIASFCLSIAAFFISIIAIIIAIFNNYTFDVDYPSLLVSVLSIIVTLLIGWQLVNYFQFESKMEKLMNNKITHFAEDYKYVMNGIIRMNIYNNALSGGCAFLIDNCIAGLHETIKCKNPNLNDFVIENIMELLNGILKEYEGNVEIYKSTKPMYLHILNGINSIYKDNIINVINKAKEIAPKTKRINTIEAIPAQKIEEICNINNS